MLWFRFLDIFGKENLQEEAEKIDHESFNGESVIFFVGGRGRVKDSNMKKKKKEPGIW